MCITEVSCHLAWHLSHIHWYVHIKCILHKTNWKYRDWINLFQLIHSFYPCCIHHQEERIFSEFLTVRLCKPHLKKYIQLNTLNTPQLNTLAIARVAKRHCDFVVSPITHSPPINQITEVPDARFH